MNKPETAKKERIVIPEEELEEYKGEIIDKIVLGDCFSVLPKLPPEIADMIFVDPPYNLQLPPKKLIRWSGTVVNGVEDRWDRFESFAEYDAFTERWLSEIKRVMKPSATIWVIGTYHNIFRIGKIMQDLGYWILNDVIWLKTNPVPNFLRVRFTNGTETLIWAVKDKDAKGYTFNHEWAYKFGYGKVGANVWELPLCAGSERLRDDKGRKIHSTQKPERLLERVILTSTKPGDLVLDPMAGTCTTGFVAKKFGRRFLMIEKEKRYVEAAAKRFSLLENLFEKP
ncbi:MAG: DNA methyltransferase [candidate division WOR-3 bacterium]